MDHSAVQLSGNAERRAWTAPTNSVDALPSMGDGAGLPPPFPDAVIRSLAPPGVGLGDLGLAEQMHAGHFLFLMCPAAQTIRMARPRGRNHAGTRANDGAKPRCQRLFSPCTHIRLNHPDGDGEDFFPATPALGAIASHRIASHRTRPQRPISRACTFGSPRVLPLLTARSSAPNYILGTTQLTSPPFGKPSYVSQG